MGNEGRGPTHLSVAGGHHGDNLPTGGRPIPMGGSEVDPPTEPGVRVSSDIDLGDQTAAHDIRPHMGVSVRPPTSGSHGAAAGVAGGGRPSPSEMVRALAQQLAKLRRFVMEAQLHTEAQASAHAPIHAVDVDGRLAWVPGYSGAGAGVCMTCGKLAPCLCLQRAILARHSLTRCLDVLAEVRLPDVS